MHKSLKQLLNADQFNQNTTKNRHYLPNGIKLYIRIHVSTEQNQLPATCTINPDFLYSLYMSNNINKIRQSAVWLFSPDIINTQITIPQIKLINAVRSGFNTALGHTYIVLIA